MTPTTLQKNLEQLIGQSLAKELLIKGSAKTVSRGYLLAGPPQVGKGFLARLLAASYHQEIYNGKPHPDTIIFDDVLAKNAEENDENQWKKSVDDFVRFINLTPAKSAYKVGIIENVDRFSVGALNALLKTIEEPPKDTIIILSAEDTTQILPTILSRVQIIRLNYLTDAEISQYLAETGGANRDQITVLANGAIGLAKQLIEDTSLLEKALLGLGKLQTILNKDIFTMLQSLQIKERDEAINLVKLWINLTRRALLTKLGQPTKSLLDEQISGFSAKDLAKLLEALREALISLEGNANVRLTLEAAALSVV